jgi:hypothetical protein
MVMDQKQMIKQMIEFNQATFNNTFQALVLLQNQFEQVAQTAIEQANWLPAEGRKAIEDWVESFKTGREQFKKHIDDSYEQVNKYFA